MFIKLVLKELENSCIWGLFYFRGRIFEYILLLIFGFMWRWLEIRELKKEGEREDCMVF